MITCRKITSHRELRKVFKLRHDVFVEEIGYTPLGNEAIEVDWYDSHAVHFGAFDDKKCVGTVRLVLDSEMGLPFEKVHSVERRATVAELSRLAIHPDYRLNGILRQLLTLVKKEAKELNIDTVYAVSLRRIEL